MRTDSCFSPFQRVAIIGMLTAASATVAVASSIKSVTVNPVTFSLSVGAQKQFVATVTGRGHYNSKISWSAQRGSITRRGLYTAPSTGGSDVVTASSVQNTRKVAIASVTVTAATPAAPTITSVSVSPAAIPLSGGAQTQFTVTVAGTGSYNSGVTWSAQRGGITSTGLYTAPSTSGNDLVTAKSTQNPNMTATANVAVSATIPVPSTITSVAVSPVSVSVGGAAQKQFAAVVTGTGSYNSGVTWSAQRGGITSTGLYTAPSTSGSDVVTATSLQNTSKAATASVIVTANTPVTPTITSVTISPSSWTLDMGTQHKFSANVIGTGSFSGGLTWSAQRGTIDGDGLYTAPSTSGSDVVTSTSVQDPSKSSSSAVSVQSSCAPSPSSTLVVNVRDSSYGAKGDGVTDDTAAIQRAVNAVAGTGGTVRVPDGTYLVNAVAQSSRGIRLGSYMTLSLSPGAVLKAIPNSSGNYAIVSVSFANHVNVVGGTLLGERGTHTDSGGEWGMGLAIDNSNYVVVQGVTAKDCWGDGFYVTDLCTNITLCNVVADHNRRQGLSVTSVNGMVVKNSIFKNTVGTDPQCGIDVEPNGGDTCNNILITGCTIFDNAGGGIQQGSSEANMSYTFATNTIIENNDIYGNGGSGYHDGGIAFSCCDSNIIRNNNIHDNLDCGLRTYGQATRLTITGNTVTNNAGYGLIMTGCNGSVVTGNTVTGNTKAGMYRDSSTGTYSPNTMSGNGQ